jgi:hypothetical protein
MYIGKTIYFLREVWYNLLMNKKVKKALFKEKSVDSGDISTILVEMKPKTRIMVGVIGSIVLFAGWLFLVKWIFKGLSAIFIN